MVFKGLGGRQGVIYVKFTPWPGLLLRISGNLVVPRTSIQQSEGRTSEFEESKWSHKGCDLHGLFIKWDTQVRLTGIQGGENPISIPDASQDFLHSR